MRETLLTASEQRQRGVYAKPQRSILPHWEKQGQTFKTQTPMKEDVKRCSERSAVQAAEGQQLSGSMCFIT